MGFWFHRPFASRDESRRITEMLELLITYRGSIMSAISDFATAQNAFNDRLDTAVANLTADIGSLTAEIAKLQATSGQTTAEDQALLDGIQSRTSTIAAKLDALDALTPPVPPTA